MFNKKGIVRIIVVVVCLVVVIVLLSRCGGSPIVGRWEVVENGLRVDYGVIRNLEFFGDGTYTSDHSNYFGSYSIEGNRLRISGVLASQKTFSFKIRGNSLSLYEPENKEYVYEFKRVE